MDMAKPIKVKKRIIRRSQDIIRPVSTDKCADASDDDTSSICSDASSCSGHRRKMKRIRRSCPIHGKQHMIKKYGDKAYDMPEFDKFKDSLGGLRACSSSSSICDEPKKALGLSKHGSSSSLTDKARCTCDNIKKKSKHSRNRPDPEGGQLKTEFMDEYEKLIYSHEPLFSDMGEDDPEVENRIRTEAEKFHKRNSQADRNIFASALSVHSNTVMKFAIIQTELKNLIEIHLKRVSPKSQVR